MFLDEFDHIIKISIHALREEGDPCAVHLRCMRQISIHALREEGDGGNFPRKSPTKNFNPRPPRGGRRLQGVPTATDWEISIHALREESDRTGRWRSAAPSYFNPRPPRGERLHKA